MPKSRQPGGHGNPGRPSLRPESRGALFGLSLPSTAVAYVIYFRILTWAGATNLLLVTFLVPVSALLLAIALLGEMLEIRQVSGMVLIGLGLAAVDGRPMAAVKRRVITMAGYNTWAGVFQ